MILRDPYALARRYKTTDPFLISRELNISVIFADLGTHTKGFYIRKLRRRAIFIHENLDYVWQRLVCAHELGHDRLHPGFSRFWLDEQSFYNAGKYERQANNFAIHLLTAGDKLSEGESVIDLLRRNGIPEIMHTFY